MTGQSKVALLDGWDSILGARGCKLQSCSLRDYFQTLLTLNVQVYGLSTQRTEYQQEVVIRLHLSYPLLSDEQLIFTFTLNLPIFKVNQLKLNKLFKLIAFGGVIQHYFYPVLPPDKM